MRKILSILATTSLVASASVAVVSCNTIQNSDFKLPKFPTNVDEAKKIILDLSKKQAVTEFKTAEMDEEGKDDSEIENFEIESRFEEYYTIILVAAHKIVKLESKDTVISVWEYNEDNVLVETEMVLWKYASVSDFYDENYAFRDLDLMIAQDLSEFPESIKGLEEMIDNFKEIRSWWLKGREVTAFSEQFNYSETELELESRDSDEAIKLGLELSKNKDINESNINFRGWGNNAGGSGEHFALASNETDKYIGYAIFNCFIK